MIRCRAARAFVQAGLERELALEERFQLELHTAGCPACAEFERRARGLQELLEGPGDPPPVAPDVEAAVQAVFLELERGPGRAWKPRGARRAAGIGAAALALACAAALLFVLFGKRPGAASPASERAALTEAALPSAEPAWSAASVEAAVRAALLEYFASAGVDAVRSRAHFLERTREPARMGWPVRRFVEGLLAGPDVIVGLAAARCLAALGETSSCAALERALARSELAEAALDALGTLGEPAVPALERALAEPELAARSVLQLCRVGGARAAAVLERAARRARPDSDPSRVTLLDALTATGPAAVESLLRLAEERERSAARAEATAILARLPLVVDGGPELARWLERERPPGDLAYRALLFVQPPEALHWLEQRCGTYRERPMALEVLAGFPGSGPLDVALRLSESGRVPRADVLALLAALFEHDIEQDVEHHAARAEVFTRECIAAGVAGSIHAWLELLIESEHPGAARALVPLVFDPSLADDDRQWAALAVGELGTRADGERLLSELEARGDGRPLAEGGRRLAACLLSIHALLGADRVERLLEPCSNAGAQRVLAALAGASAGQAVRVHRVARALDAALAEPAGASDDDEGIL